MKPSAVSGVLAVPILRMEPQEIARHRYDCRMESLQTCVRGYLDSTRARARRADASKAHHRFFARRLLDPCSGPVCLQRVGQGVELRIRLGQRRIATHVLREKASLSIMVRSRHGFGATPRPAQVARGDCQMRPMAEFQITDASAEISLTRHGRPLLVVVVHDFPYP